MEITFDKLKAIIDSVRDVGANEVIIRVPKATFDEIEKFVDSNIIVTKHTQDDIYDDDEFKISYLIVYNNGVQLKVIPRA